MDAKKEQEENASTSSSAVNSNNKEEMGNFFSSSPVVTVKMESFSNHTSDEIHLQWSKIKKEEDPDLVSRAKEEKAEEPEKDTNMINVPGTMIAASVRGIVKWFNVKSGYGFINRDDTDEDVFVHQSNIIKKSRSSVGSVGDAERVHFDVVVGTKGLEAVNVSGPDGADVRGSIHDRNYRHRAKVARAKVTKAKVTKAKVAKAKVAKAKVAKAKVAKAKVAKAKVTKAKVTKAKVTKAKMTKAKVTKATVAKHTNSIVARSGMIKRYHCEQCDYSSSSKSHLKEHISDIHRLRRRGGDIKFECRECQFSSHRKESLLDHVWRWHVRVEYDSKRKCATVTIAKP